MPPSRLRGGSARGRACGVRPAGAPRRRRASGPPPSRARATASATAASHQAGVGAVDRDAGESVDLRPPLERAAGGHRLGRRVLRVAVVLAEEDHRQAVDRGEGHRLVHGALIERAVAERGQRDTPGSVVAGRERGADADRNASADDAALTQEAALGIGEEPGSAATAVDARLAAHELAEERVDRRPAGDGPVMAAVRRVHGVDRAERRPGSDRNRLLPVTEMQRADDRPLAPELRGVVLELSDRDHPAVRCDGLRTGHLGSLTAPSI